MAYATVDDVEAAFPRSLTDAETVEVEGWLTDAGYLIDGYIRWDVDADRLLRVSVNMVIRALNAPVTAGVDSATDQAGPFATTTHYVADATSGGVWLSSTDKIMLRGAQSGFMSLQLGSERYQEPVEDDAS